MVSGRHTLITMLGSSQYFINFFMHVLFLKDAQISCDTLSLGYIGLLINRSESGSSLLESSVGLHIQRICLAILVHSNNEAKKLKYKL